MAELFDIAAAFGGVGVTSVTVPTNPVATTGLMHWVAVCWDSAQSISTAKYDGNDLTLIGSGTNGGMKWAFYYYIAPSSANKSTIITFSASTNAAVAVLVSKDSDQDAPAQTATDVNAASTTSLTALSGENYIITFQAWRQNNLEIPDSNWNPGTGTQRAEHVADVGSGEQFGIACGSATTGEAWSEVEGSSAMENVLMTIDIADFVAASGNAILTRGGLLTSGGLLTNHGGLT